MITVVVTIGVGGWNVTKTVELVACPHVGDMIVVGISTITCERVYITNERVFVNQTMRFQNEGEMKDYIADGWRR